MAPQPPLWYKAKLLETAEPPRWTRTCFPQSPPTPASPISAAWPTRRATTPAAPAPDAPRLVVAPVGGVGAPGVVGAGAAGIVARLVGQAAEMGEAVISGDLGKQFVVHRVGPAVPGGPVLVSRHRFLHHRNMSDN